MNNNLHKFSSLNTQALSIACSNILPRIHDQVYKLTVEQNSMEQILLVANYPQLYSLSLKKLPRLKCLSFTVRNIVFEYDELLVSLFCRMINLEELKLYLLVGRFNSSYIDGIQLYDQFLIYMTQIKKFTFNIKSMVYNSDVSVKLPSNEDIQRSFTGRGYQKVASYLT
ncbi:unnamed protein product [Rotaria sordida]|uniref:Uncharacterized protein n=2 Tax=Rotaria sordida TaxID=392033 RepID=A0A819C5P4_9BILA|nr:unnamed protein product [Rotaria sordida]